ncbi:hypothetical protein BKA70DRAFT_1352643, partial [Coprinopsis sp. MPI-PUGE-AT-0042]
IELRFAKPDTTKKLRRSSGALIESAAHTLNPLQLRGLPSYWLLPAGTSHGWRDDSRFGGTKRWRHPIKFAQLYPRFQDIRRSFPEGNVTGRKKGKWKWRGMSVFELRRLWRSHPRAMESTFSPLRSKMLLADTTSSQSSPRTRSLQKEQAIEDLEDQI